MTLREDADYIVKEAIRRVLPDEAVAAALKGKSFGSGRLYLVAAGKAAWQMAKTAVELLEDRLEKGIVITKYDHVKGALPRISCYEAGHPVPDENSVLATQAALDMVADLQEGDTVLFLLSGGGSALFEKPLISGEELSDITKQCEPAQVYSIVLSDILGDPLDMIASGPAYPDSSTCEQALAITDKYRLQLSEQAMELLHQETPKKLHNVTTEITGSVRNLCLAAKEACEALGYEAFILTDQLECVAREAGIFLGDIAKSHQGTEKSLAFIAGGETVVHLTGHGKGGRNQELALAAATVIDGLKNTAVFSVGSDGTDGPTDAAGGYSDHDTARLLSEKKINIFQVLQENDAYHALKETGGLIMTGATGTNVNDVAVVLVKR